MCLILKLRYRLLGHLPHIIQTNKKIFSQKFKQGNLLKLIQKNYYIFKVGIIFMDHYSSKIR